MSIEKQIIIDGVDVSECENFKPKDRFTCHPYICNCHQKPNCYFKQLTYKTHEYQNLADLLRATDIYSEVCSECRDDILLYPSISGKTSYTDNEVDRITLRKIINELKDKTQKCEKYKKLAADFKDVNKQLGYKYLTIKKECAGLKGKLKFKVQENIKLSKENRNLKNWAHSKRVEIKVNRKIKETNLEEFCRMFRFKEMQAREEKLKEWQDFENDLQWKFYKNCKEWTEMRDKYNRYRKALEEIEKICVQDRDIKDVCLVSTCFESHRVMYDIQEEILNIINQANFGKSERSETHLGESCVEPVEPPIIQEAKGEE